MADDLIEREKLADEIDPRTAAFDISRMPEKVMVYTADLIAASDFIRSHTPKPTRDSLRLEIIAGKLHPRMSDDAKILREIAGRMGAPVVLAIVENICPTCNGSGSSMASATCENCDGIGKLSSRARHSPTRCGDGLAEVERVAEALFLHDRPTMFAPEAAAMPWADLSGYGKDIYRDKARTALTALEPK